jgi:acyl-CoA reductase-like NAD-dependent aldehyde dehydrogenase
MSLLTPAFEGQTGVEHMGTLETRRESPLHSPGKFFINGKWTTPSHDRHIEVISPATEEVYMRVAAADEKDIEEAVAAARVAFDRGPWPRMSHEERAAYLVAISGELEKRAQDVADVWPNEMGILHSMAQAYAQSQWNEVSGRIQRSTRET